MLVRESLWASNQHTVATPQELERFLADDVTQERVCSRWDRDAVVVGAYDDDVLQGVVAGFDEADDAFEIHLLFVAPHCWSMGLGSVLLAAAEAEAERRARRRMSVSAAKTAVRFYEMRGYHRKGLVRHTADTAELVLLEKGLLPECAENAHKGCT